MSTRIIENHNDLIENPTPRCACMVILDTSASMGGEPITQLNEGFQMFLQALREDDMAACSVELGVLTAGGRVDSVLPLTSVLNIEQCATFRAGGMTPLGQAVNQALDELEARKRQYRANGVPYYQPWMVMISDGAPNDDWQAAARRAQQLANDRKLVSLAIGVENAEMQILSEFSNRPAKRLQGLKFGELFQWLSASLGAVSRSASTADRVALPPTDGWDSI